jgi:hypothetical protein
MEDRVRILERIEAGEISVEEGVRQLEALAGAEGRAPADAPAIHPTLVRVLWQTVFWAGAALVVGGGFLVAAVHAWGIARGWLACGWVLFALGVLGLGLGWWLQRAHWMSLRINERGGRRLSLALPLPLGLAAGVLRVARPFVPQLQKTGVDELLLAVEEELDDGRTLLVEIDEGEKGEQVRVQFT